MASDQDQYHSLSVVQGYGNTLVDVHYKSHREDHYPYHCNSTHCIRDWDHCSDKCCQQRIRARIEALQSTAVEQEEEWKHLYKDIDCAHRYSSALGWGDFAR